LGKIFVRDIRDRAPVDSIFLVKEKITAMAKNGKPYLTLRLMDRSGEVDAKVWDNVDLLSASFDKDDFIYIRSKASVYLGKMQLVISELRKVPEEEVLLADFLPETGRDMEEMTGELAGFIDSMTDIHLKGLLTAFFEDRSFMEAYRSAPAAKGMHHVYLGGLIEHSLAVAKLVDRIAPLYEGVNRDLLIAGALLHDVGKVREMAYVRSFDYTDEGKLLGHIMIGVEMVREKISAISGFPTETAMLLQHMLLSHHGQYEFGSPKLPMTLEATILNYLDDLDSKINGIRTHVEKEPENHTRWSNYHRLYDRYFYKGDLHNCREEVELVPEPESAADGVSAGNTPEKGARKDKRFQNNPFEALKDKNLDLF
jgi:3'-5' exoribonuclease